MTTTITTGTQFLSPALLKKYSSSLVALQDYDATDGQVRTYAALMAFERGGKLNFGGLSGWDYPFTTVQELSNFAKLHPASFRRVLRQLESARLIRIYRTRSDKYSSMSINQMTGSRLRAL